MATSKRPIRVFYSELDERFYATRHYRDTGNGVMVVTGERFDVTNDIGAAVERYRIMFTRVPLPNVRSGLSLVKGSGGNGN